MKNRKLREKRKEERGKKQGRPGCRARWYLAGAG